MKDPHALPPSQPPLIDQRAEQPLPGVPKRLALWELDGGMQCSIIGTCLSDYDLVAVIRKHRLEIDRNAQSYDIHNYCVRAASRDGPLARSLTKILDRRFSGAVRLMGRAAAAEDMQAVWQRLRDTGQVAAAYWAVMSHTHVPTTLKTRVFGEVHMLSHLNGHGANQLALRLADAERKCADLEARLRRSESAKLEAFAERDATRAALSMLPAQAEPRPMHPSASSTPDRSLARLQHKLAKCERALVVARGRARHAEAALDRQAPIRLAAGKTDRAAFNPRPAVPARPESRGTAAPTSHRVLYLGGRAAVVPHLRQAAEARVAAFLHHDGGVEDSLHRIEEMIAGCDAVVCPIDCVSHGACRMAKAICHRLNKRFLPIATASRSGFERALDQLAPTHAPSPDLPARSVSEM